jgi:hypothetical protein
MKRLFLPFKANSLVFELKIEIVIKLIQSTLNLDMCIVILGSCNLNSELDDQTKYFIA